VPEVAICVKCVCVCVFMYVLVSACKSSWHVGVCMLLSMLMHVMYLLIYIYRVCQNKCKYFEGW